MKPFLVTTSWDDGHKLDVRLAALLKKYGIAATFYISPKDREFTVADLLNENQIREISESFEIGAHTITHPRLTQISDAEARAEIEDSKKYLEEVTGKPVTAFCYPCGAYQKKHIAMVKDAGFTYARTIKRHSFDYSDSPLEARTSVNTYNHYSDLWKIARFAKFNPAKIVEYFQWDNLAKAMFDRMLETGGEYHLWGHSWEIEKHGDWEKLEGVLAHISGKQNASYATNSELITLRPRKLLIATPYFPPHIGGTQLYVYNIAKRLQTNFNWEICIATSGHRGFFKIIEEDYEGLKVYRLPYWLKLSNTPINPFWSFMLRWIIKKEGVLIVNAHGPVPFMSDVAARAADKLPFILTYHGGTMHKNRKLPDSLIWLYERVPFRLLLHRADFLICSSEFVRFEFLNHYSYKSTTITPGVDAKIFKPSDYVTQQPTLLFVASLTRSERHKGLMVLINAFNNLQKHIPELRLNVVGDGDMRSIYEKYVARLGLQKKIIFKGRLTGDALVAAFQQTDIFVLPSLAPSESFGMVLAEAMSTGKPVIGTRAGGIPRVIDHKRNGLLVDPNDSTALALAIQRLLDNPTLAKQLGDAAREKVIAQYDWDVHAAEYNNVLQNIPERKPMIAQVIAYYPPHLGGMEIVAKEISVELTHLRYPVKVLTSTVDSADAHDDRAIYEIERMNTFEVAHTPIMWSLPFQLLFLPKKSILHVHVSQVGIPEISILVAKLKGIPFVAHFHLDVGPSGSLGILLPFYKKHFLGRVLRAADRVVVFSEEQVEAVHVMYGVKKSNIVIIPNGVGEEFFRTEKKIPPKDRLELLYVGRLNAQKRVERLIEAMAKLKIPARLSIVGDGEDKPKLEALAKKLNLTTISFEGKQYGDELKQYYRNADVLLTSSDNEGMSLVALEAMAAGLPIIGSNVPGTRELVGKIGILVDEPYPETFADAITMLWDNPDQLQKLSVQSVEKARQYSWKKLAEKLEVVYKEIAR